MPPDATSEGGNGRESGVRGRRGGRRRGAPDVGRILKWVGGVLAGVVILYLGAALALRTLVPPETVAAWAEPRAEAALNRDVEIGGAELAIFPHLGLALEDVTVGNLAGFQGPPLARAERAELRVALWPLVRGDVVVDEAVARGLDVRVQVDEDGDTNYGDLLPASAEPDTVGAEQGLPVSLAVRSVGLEGSRLEYRDRQSGRLFLLDDLRLQGSLARGEAGWELETDAAADRVTATLPSFRDSPMRPGGATLRLSMRAGPDFGWVEVGEGRLSVGGVPLSVTGRVDSITAPVRRLSLGLDADSLDLASLAGSAPAGAVPDAVESLAGTATVQIGVTGELGEGSTPEVSGQIRLRGVGATLAERGRVAEDVGGTVRLRGDTLALEGMEGTVLGGPFRMSGAVALDSARAFSGSVQSTVSLSALRAPGAEAGPTGTVEASLDLAGEASRPAATSADGSVLLREVVVPADSPRSPVRIPRGELSFVDRAVTWTDLTVAVGEDRITTTGRLDRWGGFLSEDAGLPTLRGRAESGRLDLDRLLPKPDDSPTYGQLLFVRLGRDSVGGRATADVARELGYTRPPTLPVAGELEVAVDTLLFAPYRFAPMTARLEFGPDLIRVSRAELGVFGGTLAMTLSASLGEAAQQPFSATLEGRGLRAADFLATSSPMGRLLTGTASLDLEAAGRLDGALLPVRDSLVGSGRFTVDGGGMAQNPVTSAVADMLTFPALRSPSVERVAVPFRLEGTRVRFDTARLAAPVAGVSWAGSMDLGGSLELGASLEVPRSRVPELSLKGAGLPGELLSRIRQGEGPLQLGLGVGGTISSPRVGLDTDALRARAEEAARGAAREAVEKKIDEGRNVLEKRARGLLQRLTGPRDTAAASDTSAAPDTAAADTTGLR
ncbi:MAG: AsmA family protein [Candidatus Palauibacterales bacterium]|nr:AsmA family protein [Candidatus Palauibacterales bacterium]